MKKYFTSFVFVIIFTGYSVYHYLANAAATPTAPSTSTLSGQGTDTGGTVATVVPSSTPSPTPASKPTGQYVDGTYTGDTANAYYGFIQVQATISGGKLTDIQFLQYPNDRGTSIAINQQAMPILAREAIQAQSANVNGVSGASDTSAAFQESLATALQQAKS
jgi:uncharacterized protein with FMN-binding domain